jgi:putative holliday junction resolvase
LTVGGPGSTPDGSGADVASGRPRAGEVVLALDAGEARTGLAVGRVGSGFAFGRGTVPGGDAGRTLEALRPVIEAEGVARLVVGLPLRTDGADSPQTTRVRRLAAHLGALGLPIDLVDERFTSQAATRALRGSGLPLGKRRQKGRVDEASAVLILETWLATHRDAPSAGADADGPGPDDPAGPDGAS